MTTIEICKEVSTLCAANGAEDWAHLFDYFISKIETEPWSDVRRDILKVFGGMGSFNDLVLHKDRKPLGKENNRLDELRSKLFELVCFPSPPAQD